MSFAGIAKLIRRIVQDQIIMSLLIILVGWAINVLVGLNVVNHAMTFF